MLTEQDKQAAIKYVDGKYSHILDTDPYDCFEAGIKHAREAQQKPVDKNLPIQIKFNLNGDQYNRFKELMRKDADLWNCLLLQYPVAYTPSVGLDPDSPQPPKTK
jgi:hypothetical protein